MQRQMKPVRIFLVLCSAVMACNGENPIRPGSGDRTPVRRVERHDSPVDLLRALETARGADRARALERLGLTKDAIAAWNEVVRERSEGSENARKRLDALARRPDPMDEWSASKLRDEPQRLAQAYPFESMRELLDTGLADRVMARLVADVLAENGDPYLRKVLQSLERPADRAAMELAMRAYRDALASKTAPPYERAAVLLEHAGNPLYLYARYRVAALRFSSKDVVPLLDALIPLTDRHYWILSSSLHTLRAGALEQRGSYFLAYPEYADALGLGQQSATQRAAILSRRSLNYTTIGSFEKGLDDAIAALDLLPRVPDLNTRSTAYASAAKAATELGYPDITLLYSNAVVETAQKAVLKGDQPGRAEHVLAVALRARADAHGALNDIAAAEVDLGRARDLAEALNNPVLRQPLTMRIREVEGDTLLPTDAAKAAAAFQSALDLAAEQHPTYRAALLFKLAEARRGNGEPDADDDVDTAFAILREEAKQLLDATARGDYEQLWGPYFSRFREMHRAAIQRSIEQGQVEEAFVQDEQARAFELLHALLQARSTPPDFRPVALDTLERNLAALPEDTVILQYLVLADRTYVWVLRRGQKITVFRLSATEKQIDQWHDDALDVLHTKQPDSLKRPMRAVYAELFRTPLAASAGAKRIVIVPDGPMHGLPFAALEEATKGYLLERVKSLATDGSTSRYLYAVARDAQFGLETHPSVLLTAATAFDRNSGLDPLLFAQPEVDQLRRDSYPQAKVLSGAEATVPRFLAAARGATIVHFAGHALPVPRRPWESRLLLAAQSNDSGELTAETLMRELSVLERTRLVVLGACSTAGGQPVGPEGLAPLVRPLIAANVPAVVGTLWDVKDATAKDLLVSLHCHYRHGDDVAEALRAAQLERLRDNDPAMMWAPYQVVGYAGSPYPRDPALEKTHNESVCAQHSLQRPDGLHPE
jgi:CHAT domain-containing protein